VYQPVLFKVEKIEDVTAELLW